MNRKVGRVEPSHAVSPYDAQKGSPVWKIVDEAINDLVKNKDLVETTRRDYIVGFICEKLLRTLPMTDD
jgi:hypothetical protein